MHRETLTTCFVAITMSLAIAGLARTQSFGSCQVLVLPNGDMCREVAGGDVTGDSLSDLVVASYGGAIAVFPGVGGGSFIGASQIAIVPFAGPTHGLVLVDLDGDQDLDGAVVDSDTVHLVENQSGSIVYSQSIPVAAGAALSSICGADMDGDADMDVIVAGAVTVGWEIFGLENLGAGGFTVRSILQVLPPPNYSILDVAPADLDGDGDQDLVFGLEPDLAVTLNNGSWSFGPHQVFPAGSDNQQIVVSDLDGNGSPDVAGVSFGSQKVWVYLNLGTSGSWLGFGPRTDLLLGGFGLGLVALDVNGDGHMDLAGAVNDIAEVEFFLNDGFGSFTPGGTVATPSSPWHLAAGDIDGDGQDDLLGARFDSTIPGPGPAGAYVYTTLPTSPTPYCTAGISASGCTATISATGVASASATSGFVLSATGVEGQKPGLFFFGTNGRQANPWGNGSSFQCVVPPVKRAGSLVPTGSIGACDGAFAQDLNALWCPVCPQPAKNPGAACSLQAQFWFRDPLSTSNQATSLSNAIEVPVGP